MFRRLLIVLLAVVPCFPSVFGQRVTDGLVAEYRLSQCDCDAGLFPSELSNPSLPLLGACPTLTIPGFNFNFPTTQGVTVGESLFAVSSGSSDFEDIDIANTSGFTLEYFVDPKEEGSFVLSELLDAADSLLLSVSMTVSTTSVNFTVSGSDDSAVVELPQNVDPLSVGTLHSTVVFQNVVDGFDFFPCVDGVCSETTAFVNTSVAGFSKVQVLGVDDTNNTAAQLVTFSIYDRDLSSTEVDLNNADRSILVDIPVVASELFIETQEDENMIIRLDELSFFLSNQPLDDVPTGATFTVNENIITEAGQVAVDLPSNVYTTVGDDDCAFITPGANSGGVENSVGVVGLECSQQTVDIRLCIREVNDPPVVIEESDPRNLFFADESSKVVLNVLVGTDVDDDDTLALGDPAPVNPGKLRGLGTMVFEETLFLNYSKFEGNQCTNEIITEVDVGDDGRATFCVSPSSTELFSTEDVNFQIEYTVVDAAGAQSEIGVLPIVVVADFLEEVPDLTPIIFLSGIAVLVLLCVCGVAYKLKQRSDEGESNPIGNFLGGNLAY